MRHVLSHGGHYLAVIALCVTCARPLAAAEWTRRAPGLAIAVWQALMLSVWLSLVGLSLSVALAGYRTGELAGLVRLAGDADPALGPVQWTALAAAAALTCALAALTGRFAVGVLRARRRHRHLLDLVGTRDGGDVQVLPHPAVVAYCLPGRGGRLVVSSGAVAALSSAELRAVLAHERAHAAERHDLVLLPFAALAALRLPLSALSLQAVSLLVEMRADDRACAAQGRDAVRRALRVFATASLAAVPAGALGAAGQVAERLRRVDAGLPRLRAGAAALVVAMTVTVATTAPSLMLPW
ncbi:M56 family metallopeptidase [Catellatospora sichuanensis]|uniref:M56 family metallopeptidase n=1 Tax=Catellatospora sichuanensis TaxID=1969805 RepID=UPI00118268A9|nr:M56 family metallopeptidase [Catellatospora sichuanensis]